MNTQELLRAYKNGLRNFKRAYLSGAYLSRAYLSGTDLSGADLSGAYLSGADLSGADLSGAYLSGANLSGANLSGAYLSEANLSGADLSGADLSGAYLPGADLSGAYLPGAKGIASLYIPYLSSRGDLLYAVRHGEEIYLKAGCFWGTYAVFSVRVMSSGRSHKEVDCYQKAAMFLVSSLIPDYNFLQKEGTRNTNHGK